MEPQLEKKNNLTFFQDTFLEWEYNLNALSRPQSGGLSRRV